MSESKPMGEPRNIHEAAAAIEKELELPEGFLSRLHKEDDWSFVVKLHALIESACTYLLVKATNRPELEEIFSRLDIANKATGKMAFIKALNVLDEKVRAFIHALASLRNSLVHNIRSVPTFSLRSYVESLDSQQLSNFLKAIYSDNVASEIERSGQNKREVLIEGAKFMLWLNAVNCLANIYIVMKQEEFRQERRRALVDLVERFRGLRTELIRDMLKDRK